ncbi:hypothetical protein PIB30_111456, partial [Stylosanthes scabra]|nr:hypothetical protein [Stylosanthes scabra]
EVSTHMHELPRICVEALSKNVEWEELAHIIRESSRITWALCLVPHVYTLYVARVKIALSSTHMRGLPCLCVGLHFGLAG